MGLKIGSRVSAINCLVQSVVLLCCLRWANSNPLSRSLSCNPRDGLTGPVGSIVIRVKRFVDMSINFRRDKPRLLSTVHHTIANDGKTYFFGNHLKAKFHGREVCFSAVKETVLNEKGAAERRLYSCEQVCLEAGNEQNLVTNSSSGGRLWPGKGCCVWNKETFFQLTVMAVGPHCVKCQGRECLKEQMTTKQCPPGDKCVAVTLNQQSNKKARTNSSIVPIMLGCSSDDSLRGYTCNDGCRTEVKLVGSGTRNVCVRCCTGNECNKVGEAYKNETETAAFEDREQDSVVQRSGSHNVSGCKNLVAISLMWILWFFKSKVDLEPWKLLF